MFELELVREEAVIGDSGVGEKYESPTKPPAGEANACKFRVLSESWGWFVNEPDGIRGG